MEDNNTLKIARRARLAQAQVAKWSFDDTLELAARLGREMIQEEFAQPLAELAVSETGFGTVEDTKLRFKRRVVGTIHDFRFHRRDAIDGTNPSKGIQRLAKPVGIVAAITAATSAPSAVACNILSAIFARNAVVVCPNPVSHRTATMAVQKAREVLANESLSPDLCQLIERPSRASFEELSRLADVVVAAGGQGVVERANASGTPALTGGKGNAVVVVDSSADIKLAARSIVAGKSFDNGTSCSAESIVLVERSVETELLSELRANNAFLCSPDEVLKIEALLRPDGQAVDRRIVGKAASTIAGIADIIVPANTSVIATPISGAKTWRPLLGEKLCPVFALTSIDSLQEAIEIIGLVTAHEGAGHSCGIFTARDDHVELMANELPVSRLMVNQSTGLGNSGSFGNGLPFTVTLGCGPWGRGISNDNINWRHLVNWTTVSEPLPDYESEAIAYLEQLIGEKALAKPIV